MFKSTPYHNIFCVVLGFIVLTLSGCFLRKKQASQEGPIETEKLIAVTLVVKKTVPYCKGMPPTEDEMNLTALEEGRSFFLTKQDDTTFKQALTTNQKGEARLMLTPGLYCVKIDEKSLSFDEFYSKFSGTNTNSIMYGDKACFWNWWVSCDGEFKVSEGETLQQHEILRVYRCNTADHPCKYYIGPMPPSSR